jgi:hypothetical protein
MKTLAPDWEITTPGPLARLHGIAVAKVHAWIVSGALAAANLATSTDKRPVYKIQRSDWDKFWASRAVVPATAPPEPRTRRANRLAPVRDYV